MLSYDLMIHDWGQSPAELVASQLERWWVRMSWCWGDRGGGSSSLQVLKDKTFEQCRELQGAEGKL